MYQSGVQMAGSNVDGQLGDGSGLDSSTPIELPGGYSDWTSIGGGLYHTCAVRGGRLYCWGYNYSGQLGNGAFGGTFTTPTEVAGGFTDWTTVATGAAFEATCGIRAGRIFCWGYNYDGQLGDGTNVDSAVPVEVSGAYADWQDVRLGAYHACARRQGRLYCWGWLGYGQLGTGDASGARVALQGP